MLNVNQIKAVETFDHIRLDDVTIYSISTKIDKLNYQAIGSVQGGTYIYIKAIGLDPTPSNNKILVGPYDCLIPEKGINEVFLTCQTTEAWDPARRINLDVQLFVQGKKESYCATGVTCKFTYQESATPYLKAIVNRATTPNGIVSWYAAWRTDTTKDIKKLLIGSQLCTRFEVEGIANLNDNTSIDKNNYQFVQCNVPDDMVSGHYNANVESLWGYPRLYDTTTTLTSDTKKAYQFRIISEITKVSSNTGGNQGQELTITGAGFGVEQEKITVLAGGLNCAVKQVTNNQIQCKVLPGATSPATGATQFYTGAGLRYTKYKNLKDYCGSDWDIRTKVKNDDVTLQDHVYEEGTLGEFEIIDNNEWTGSWVRGFLKAPKTGNFRFKISADDNARLWFNPIPNDADRTKFVEAAKITDANNFRNYFYYTNTNEKTTSDTYALEEGKLYYVESFQLNGYGGGFLTISLEMENTTDGEDYSIISMFDAQQYSIDYTSKTPEKYSIKVYNHNNAFAIQFYYKNTQNVVEYDRTTEARKWSDWSAAGFREQIEWGSGYYDTLVEIKDLDISGNYITDVNTPINGREWIITFRRFRSQSNPIRNMDPRISKYSIPSNKYSISRIQEASPPIRGTYTLTIKNQLVEIQVGNAFTTDIPYNVSSQTIYDGIRKIIDNPNIEHYYFDRENDGYKYGFVFRGVKENIPDFIFDDSNLTGGDVDTKPVINLKKWQEASRNYLFEPIPNDMLVLPSTLPQVLVYVGSGPNSSDKIMSTCDLQANCSYQVQNEITPILNSFSIAGNTLSFSLGQVNAAITASQIQVTYAGATCSNIIVTSATNIACTLPLNADQTLKVEGGNQIPIVHVSNVGYAQFDTNVVTAIVNPITIVSLNKKIGSINGGELIKITGTGFPLTLKSGLQIKVGANLIEGANFIMSSNNQEIQFLLPKIHADDYVGFVSNKIVKIQVLYNGQQSDISGSSQTQTDGEQSENQELQSQAPLLAYEFTYSTVGVPKITSLSMSSASPVVKQQITINGSDFGNDPTKIQVFLDSTEQVGLYQLGVVPDSFSDTSFQAVLGGGHVGNYKLRVYKQVYGNSIADDSIVSFSYTIQITSVTPSSGSINGGTVVTITGINFCPEALDNSVFVNQGDENLFCQVLEESSTQIKFIIPPMTDQIVVDQPCTIVVQGKLLEDSICAQGSTCTFTYKLTDTPSLTLPTQLIYDFGDNVFLEGHGFQMGTGIEVLIGSQTVTAVVESDTQMRFSFPNLQNGSYMTLINVINKGYAGVLDLTSSFKIKQIPSSSQSLSQGGSEITILGNGFKPTATVTVGTLGSCFISQILPNSIKCRTASSTLTTSHQIKVIQDGVTIQSTDSATLSVAVTPKITAFTNTTVGTVENNGVFSVTITGTNFNSQISAYVERQQVGQQYVKIVSDSCVQGANANIYIITFSKVPAGVYKLFVYFENMGYAYFNTAAWQTITISFPTATSQVYQSSFAGGKEIVINGAGFFEGDSLKGLNQVTVCGFNSTVTSATYSQLTIQSPPVLTKKIIDYYNFNQMPMKITYYSYQANSINNAYKVDDNKVSTYYTSSGVTCFIGFDFGANVQVLIEKAEFTPQIQASVLKFNGAKLQGSNDNTTWTDLKVLDYRQHLGVNTWRPDTQIIPYRFFRYTQTVPTGQTAFCELSELAVYGNTFYKDEIQNIDTNTIDCSILINVNTLVQTLDSTASKVVYSKSNTPTVTDISPKFGYQLGGTTITITGTGFGSDATQISIKIDNIVCNQVSIISDTSLTCVTGDKGAANLVETGILIKIAGVYAAIQDKVHFYYGLRYSASNTWGFEAPPREGDSIYVPAGQTLIIDQSTPILYLVEVEGRIIFSDEQDMTFDANFIIVRYGSFIIGTEEDNYSHKLTITMHGDYQGKQLPEFGNKVLGCHHCTLDIHGQKKLPTWTMIDTTLQIGATSLKTTQKVNNWLIGDVIVITSSDIDHNQAERVTITSLSQITEGGVDKTIINFTPALVYRHFSEIEKYDQTDINMKIEVGNLSRNIVFRGDDQTVDSKYGAHLMIHGNGAHMNTARIEYAEFYNTGQPRILGRYTIHYHMNGDMSGNYVRGISAHDTFARIITLHAVSYMLLEWNVGFRARGHNIFFEDGVETNNVVQYNLVISSLTSSWMLQTDLTVASYWVTHPTNFYRYNHAAGSDFYGHWYEIKFPNPDGPSATAEICPPGMPLGEYHGNVAHSNRRFGLRIFEIIPRQKPCQDPKNEQARDIWVDNPSIQQVYSNFTTWKNGECGVLAERMGNAIFRDFKVVDSYRGAFQSHQTNFTSEEVILENWVVVGISRGNPDPLDLHQISPTNGIILPRTDGFRVKNIQFHNFNTGMFLVEQSSDNQHVKLWVQGGKQSTFENVKIFNCTNSGIISYRGPRHNLIYDQDGSLTGRGEPTYITPYMEHLKNVPGCTKIDDLYSSSSVCSSGVKLRPIQFRNPVPWNNFQGMQVKSLNLIDGDIGDNENKAEFSQSIMEIIKNPEQDMQLAWAQIYADGYTYNVHFKEGIDWQHLLLVPARYASDDDKTIVLRFNYTEHRELYEIKQMIGGKLIKDYNEVSLDTLIDLDTQRPNNDPVTGCKLGDYHQDQENSFFYVCVTKKNREILYETVDLNGIYCKDLCAKSTLTCAKESLKRQWSEKTQWDLLKLRKPQGATEYITGFPTETDDVLVPCEWNLEINIPLLKVNQLFVDGTLIFSRGQETTRIEAKNIWVRGGEIIAGSQDAPYDKQIEIVLQGDRSTENVLIDNGVAAGGKVLAVTGRVALYGVSPATKFARLTASATIGDKSITVSASTGWQVGDEIVIGPTNVDYEEFEKRTIVTITSNVITFDDPLLFFHYGSNKVTVSGSNNGKVNIDASFGGDLDMRATVGHLTRNIKIIGTDEGNGWGATVFVYYWNQNDDTIQVKKRGYIIFDGVEIIKGGKKDQFNAGIYIQSTNIDEESDWTVIQNSAIHDCSGICIKADNTRFLKINQNVIFKGERFLISNLDYKDSIITNNLLIGAMERKDNPPSTLFDPVVLLYMYSEYNAITDNVQVYGNVGQGSGATGYVFPGTIYSQKDSNGFHDNEVGVCKYVNVQYSCKQNEYYFIEKIAAYHAEKGVMFSSKSSQNNIEGSKIRVAEAGVNIDFRMGTDFAKVVSGIIRDSWSSAAARIDCTECYKNYNSFTCQNTTGFQLMVANDGMFGHPFKIKPTAYDVLCVPTSNFASQFLERVTFHNFKQEYTLPAMLNCTNNSALHNHPAASDATSGNYLLNVTCIDCNNPNQNNLSLFKMDEPQVIWRGWFGGCGDFDCTGLENVLVVDWNGTLDGSNTPKSYISMNELVGDTEYMRTICHAKTLWNAYQCDTTDFAIMEWQSIAPDKQLSNPVPIYINNSLYQNQINLWREWKWVGPEPQNRRLNNYVSLITLGLAHNVTFSGTNPVDMVHRIGHRQYLGEPDQYVIWQYQYQTPLSIQVLVNGKIVPPASPTAPYDLNLNKTDCGANNYFYENRTIHFVINGNLSCIVRVRQVNSVQVSTRLKMTVEEFIYDHDKQTNFINRIASFLNITMDRIKIVGVVASARLRILQTPPESGINVTFTVDSTSDPLAPSIGTKETGYDPVAAMKDMQKLSDKLVDAITQAAKEANVPLDKVEPPQLAISNGSDQTQIFDVKKYYLDEEEKNEEEEEEKEEDKKIIPIKKNSEKESLSLGVLLGIVFGVVGGSVIIFIGYTIWKKAKVRFTTDKKVQQKEFDEKNYKKKEILNNPDDVSQKIDKSEINQNINLVQLQQKEDLQHQNDTSNHKINNNQEQEADSQKNIP